MAEYGEVQLMQTAAMADNFAQMHMLSKPLINKRPLSMERNGLAFGVLDYWCSLMAVSVLVLFVTKCTANCQLQAETYCHFCGHTFEPTVVRVANSVPCQASVLVQDICEVQRAVRQLAQIQSL